MPPNTQERRGADIGDAEAFHQAQIYELAALQIQYEETLRHINLMARTDSKKDLPMEH